MPPIDLRAVCLVPNLVGRAGMGMRLDGHGGSSPVFDGTRDGVVVVLGSGLCPMIRLLWG